jgi:hypothetical protein
MRSILEARALAILTIWRGDTLNVPLHRLRRSPSPGGGGNISNYGGNHRDNCVIPEIALEYDPSGQPLLCASAPPRDINCIWCPVARLCLAAVHVAKLSPSPSGEEGPVRVAPPDCARSCGFRVGQFLC